MLVNNVLLNVQLAMVVLQLNALSALIFQELFTICITDLILAILHAPQVLTLQLLLLFTVSPVVLYVLAVKGLLITAPQAIVAKISIF